MENLITKASINDICNVYLSNLPISIEEIEHLKDLDTTDTKLVKEELLKVAEKYKQRSNITYNRIKDIVENEIK
ncbi:hypothetical protein [Prevotella melaninogenica]|uniref:hypothetical protein n=1 Tax=Prevotella melaninogenica TaxID=28132 RepID=UPI00241CEF5F|nr:hypothetical protein [Prevotella melaninogenica]